MSQEDAAQPGTRLEGSARLPNLTRYIACTSIMFDFRS